MVIKMKIAVIANYNKGKATDCCESLLDILSRHDCEVSSYSYQFDNSGYDEVFKKSEFIIAVGGDGTIIHTAKAAARYNKPVLGVNAGKMGYTAGVEANELELISGIFSGNYEIQKRYMTTIEVISGSEKKTYLSLNDAVIAGMYSKIIDYNMEISGHEKYGYRADGLVIATPTGSTAYSLSAGGPVIEPTMRCMTYTPICPHSLFNRSVIFDKGTVLEVTLGENTEAVHLTIDGSTPIPISNTDKVIFKCSDECARLLWLNNRNFYDVLYSKMLD